MAAGAVWVPAGLEVAAASIPATACVKGPCRAPRGRTAPSPDPFAPKGREPLGTPVRRRRPVNGGATTRLQLAIAPPWSRAVGSRCGSVRWLPMGRHHSASAHLDRSARPAAIAPRSMPDIARGSLLAEMMYRVVFRGSNRISICENCGCPILQDDKGPLKDVCSQACRMSLRRKLGKA